MEQLTIKIDRPKWDHVMLRELATIAGEVLNNWCHDETPLEDCINTAERILKYHKHDNGYELAKAFDDEGFSPDPSLVEELDSISYEVFRILKKHVQQWVIQNDLKLDLQEGQRVLFKGPWETEGEIVKLYPETMQYGVYHEAAKYKKGEGHLIIDSEHIVKVLV